MIISEFPFNSEYPEMIIFRLIGPGPDCVLASCVFAFCDQPTTTADPHLWRRAIQPTKLGTGRSPRSQGLSFSTRIAADLVEQAARTM